MYLRKPTSIHRLNPLTKIFACCLLCNLIIIFTHPFYLLGVFIIIFIIGIIGKCFHKLVRVIPAIIIVCLISVILSHTYTYQFEISKKYILCGISTGFKISEIIYIGIIFFSCITLEEIEYGLRRLSIHRRFVYGLTVILRWLMVISKIKRRITQSQIIRGKKVSTNIWKCIKDQFFTSYLILNIATYKTKAILHAMKMKGFNIDVQRYYSAGYNVEIRDYITLTVLVFLNAVCLFLRWNGYGIIE